MIIKTLVDGLLGEQAYLSETRIGGHCYDWSTFIVFSARQRWEVIYNSIMRFVDHIPQPEYPAGALAAALYLVSGVRGMERGTMSEQRDAEGNGPLADMELVRLAMPRRVFTLSQVNYVIDRLDWLYQNRRMIGGMEWEEEPEILRFFYGRLRPKSDWVTPLVAKFREDFGDSL